MANTGLYDEDFDDLDSVFEAQSDTDSNFADSPADGYFGERAHPRDVFVENSSVSAEAEAKAREAAAARRASGPSQLSPSRSVAWPEAAALSVDTEPPPPDYEVATQASSSRYTSPASPHNFTYGSFSAPYLASMGDHPAPVHASMPFHVAARTPQGLPQSMSDSVPRQPSADEETGLLGHPSARKKTRWCGLGSVFRPTSMCNGILILSVLVLIMIVMGNGSEASADDGEVQQPHLPDRKPHEETPTIPVNPNLPTTPPFSSRCPNELYSETSTFLFSGLHNFSFAEFMDRSDHISGRLGGTVVIRPAEEGQDADVKLSLTYATTRPWRVLWSNYDLRENAFVLQSPKLQKNYDADASKPCVFVFVAIQVRPGVVLEAWETTTSNLDIDISEGLFIPDGTDKNEGRSGLQITGPSSFNTVSGNVSAAYWSSRETVIDVIAGSITGKYALQDLLNCKSQAGFIDVDIEPQEADEHRPRPAESVFSTVAGSITARYPTEGYIPEREYKTRVEGLSSSIHGSWILGSLTSLHTKSGSITADFLPFFDRKAPAKFWTDTRSGSTMLTILPPHKYPSETWAKTHFTHKSTSTHGAIAVAYPPQWEGDIEAHALAGGVRVRGDGVKILKDQRLGPMRTVVAVKGHGANELEVHTTSGDVQVAVGDV